MYSLILAASLTWHPMPARVWKPLHRICQKRAVVKVEQPRRVVIVRQQCDTTGCYILRRQPIDLRPRIYYQRR